MDAEMYVDTGLALSRLDPDIGFSGDTEQMRVWTHINASVSPDLYHVEQDWIWLRHVREEPPRTYSFLGLYRKYCEADLYEIIRLKDEIR